MFPPVPNIAPMISLCASRCGFSCRPLCRLGPVPGLAPARPLLGRGRRGTGLDRATPSALTAGPCLSLETLFDREHHRDALVGRRACAARHLQNLSPAACALIAAEARDHLSASGILDSLHLSKGADTWNRYASVVGAWFSHLVRHGLSAIPAYPVRFALAGQRG